MNKAVKVRYYIESLCIYDFKQDEIINALYDLLNSLEDETVLTKQSRFFNLLSSHHSLRHYVSKLILTDDNVFNLKDLKLNEGLCWMSPQFIHFETLNMLEVYGMVNGRKSNSDKKKSGKNV